jgi:hypothetical protein
MVHDLTSVEELWYRQYATSKDPEIPTETTVMSSALSSDALSKFHVLSYCKHNRSGERSSRMQDLVVHKMAKAVQAYHTFHDESM